MIKDSGNRTPMGNTGFVRDRHDGKGRYDLLPWHAIGDVAKHCEEGAKKYGERNIDKGAPQHSLIDSGIRHLTKYIHGETDEPHLRAAAWNILWALEQETTHPELNDLPNREKVYPDCNHDGVDLRCDICARRDDDPYDIGSPCHICRHNTIGESKKHPCMFEFHIKKGAR